MYVPTFSLTNTIVSHLIRLELAIHDIRSTPLSAKVQKSLLHQQSSSNISALATLLKIPLSQPDASNLASGRDIPLPGSKSVILANYRSTSDFMYASSNDPYLSLSASLLLHLNKLLLNTIVESWESGRFRSIMDTVSDPADPLLKDRELPRLSIDPQRYFTDVLHWFGEKRHQVHPAIKCACVISELYRWYPFMSGNFITMLASTELLMERSRLSLKGLFPVAGSFLNHKEQFIDALSSIDWTTADVTGWIETYLNGISSDMISLKNDVVRAAEKKVHLQREQLLVLNPRQQRLVRHLQYHPRISRREYVGMTGVSTMTAYRDLNELVRKKLVSVHHGGRSTYYRLPKPDDAPPVTKLERKKTVVRVINDSEMVI